MNLPAKPLRLAIAQKICRPLPPLLAQTVRTWLYSRASADRDNFNCTVRAQTGALLEGTTRDFHFYPFSVHGYYEWRNVAVALALAAPGDTIIEVGANVATETVSFADIVGPQGTVHAFEPLPANLARLRRAMELAPQRNIVPHALALSNQGGSLRFVVPPTHASGMGHLAQTAAPTAETVEVAVETLDSLAAQLGPAKLIFMDTEGEESNILRGGRDYLRTYRPHLVLEASPKLLHRAGSSLEELHRLLIELGYVIYCITRFGLERAVPDAARGAENWVGLSEATPQLSRRIRALLQQCAWLPCVLGLNPLSRPRVR